MTMFTRRTLVKGGTAAATGALTGPALLDWAKAWAQSAPWKPEKNSQLSMLRWKYFVQSEDDAFVKLIEAFTQATGVKVNISREVLRGCAAEGLRRGQHRRWSRPVLGPLLAAASVSAKVCRCVGRRRLSRQEIRRLGAERGAIRQERQQVDRGAGLLQRQSDELPHRGLEEGRILEFPKTTDEFLAYAKAMKAQGTPGGLALGHASGDGNGWIYWCLWAHGGNHVDKSDKVTINSAETEKALNFAKALYAEMVPGTASWNDAFNNKAFLANEIHWTNNGISIYVAANRDPNLKKIGDDMNHAYMPIGSVGKPTELHLMYPVLAMTHTKYPQACKALIAFMMESDQFNPWIGAAQGYLTHCLNAYDSNPVWTADPKRTVYRDVAKRSLTAGGQGSVGEKAAAAIADFVLLDMFASYCTGREDAKAAMRIAERQLQRIYR